MVWDIMSGNIRLSADEIKSGHENALDIFYSGIRSSETRRTMNGNLEKFLLDACADIFSGDYRERARQFAEMAKEDQEKATSLVLAYARKLRERTMLDKSNPGYLNPSTLPNKVKAVKKFLDMNGLGLGWKRVYVTFPDKDNTHKGRGYTRHELQKMLEYSRSIETDFVILASSSGGFRSGSWNGQRWENVFPIYEVNGTYKIEIEKDDAANVVCAGMVIYKGTPDEYVCLISLEAWNKLVEYKKIWTERMKRPPTSSDYLVLARYVKPTPITDLAIKRRIWVLLLRTGLRSPLTEGRRRHQVPITNGFRRYWDRIMMENGKRRGTLSALVIKERLMGHTGVVTTDKNYFWTDILDLVPEYLDAMPELVVGEEMRLRHKLEIEKREKEKLAASNNEKEQALQKLAELEAKVRRMEKYS